MKHILVGVDFSDPSRRALEMARYFRARLHAAVSLVHVHDTAMDLGIGMVGPVGIPQAEQLDSDLVAQQREHLEKLASELFGPDRQAIRVHVEVGKPVDTLLVIGKREGADLLCIGTSGRTGVDRALLGSVAEKLVRKSPIPVLTVH